MNGEMQYVADTLLINKVAKLNTALSDDIKKQAGILDTLSDAVNTYVLNYIDTSSPGALTKSVIDLLSPAIFFRINPLFGILYTIGQSLFGFSLTSVLSSITSKIIPKITAGEKVSPNDINEAGKTMISTASDDWFVDLRQLEREDKLTKISLGQYYSQRNTVGGPFIPAKNTPLLYKVFGFLGQSKGKSLLVGFVVWLIKTILMSAGLLAVGSGAANLLGFGKKPKAEPQTEQAPNFPGQQIPTEQTPSTKAPATPMVGLQPSGKGQEYYTNDMNSMWVIPLNGKSPEQMLLSWTTEIYPQLSGYDNIILSNPAFQRTLNLISRNYRQGKDLIIPPGFSRKVDIVNQFAGNVWNDAKNMVNNV